jgi:hypothetical protein
MPLHGLGEAWSERKSANESQRVHRAAETVVDARESRATDSVHLLRDVWAGIPILDVEGVKRRG